MTLTPVLLGENTVLSQQDYLSAGQAEAFSLRAMASGVTGAIHLYIDLHNRARTVIVGLYSNAGSRPGSLLSTGSGAVSAAGTWTTVPVAPIQLTSGVTYWLAILGEGGTLRYRDRGHGSCPSQTSAQVGLGGLPTSWSTGSVYADCPASVYVTPAATVEPPPVESPPAPVESPPTEPSPPPAESPPPPPTEPPSPVEPSPPLPPTNVALPIVSGTMIEGSTLTAGTGLWLGSPTAYAYRWQDCDTLGANCIAIAGATASIYTLASSDVGQTVRVVVTASNAGGSSSATSLAGTPVIARVLTAPTNTEMPAITGSTVEGQVVSASTGAWTGNPTSYNYQWRDCSSSGRKCTSIDGATASHYTLAASDVNHTMRVMVTAANTAGSSSMSSPATAAVGVPAPSAPTNIAPPTVSGTASEGQSLSATSGSWLGAPTSYAYQWQDCDASGEACSDVSGATGSNYTLGAGDVGQTVRVIVTATNAGGSAAASSGVTSVIAASPPPPPPPPAAPVNTVLPVISGSTIEGRSLSATTGSWSGGPSGYGFQWQDCDASGGACVDVGGAVGSSFTLGSGDVGHAIRVVVTAVNAGGSSSVASGQVGVVTAAVSGGAGCTVIVSSLSGK